MIPVEVPYVVKRCQGNSQLNQVQMLSMLDGPLLPLLGHGGERAQHCDPSLSSLDGQRVVAIAEANAYKLHVELSLHAQEAGQTVLCAATALQHKFNEPCLMHTADGSPPSCPPFHAVRFFENKPMKTKSWNKPPSGAPIKGPAI